MKNKKACANCGKEHTRKGDLCLKCEIMLETPEPGERNTSLESVADFMGVPPGELRDYMQRKSRESYDY